jgi:hypothetical protein
MALHQTNECSSFRKHLETAKDDFEVIWGAQRIGRVLGVTPRQAFYMLEHRKIKGAVKIGERWCITAKTLRANFEPLASNAG